MLALIDTRDEFDDLLGLYLPIGVAVAAVVFALTLFAIVRYRRRGDEIPSQRDNPWRTAVGAAVFTFIFLIFLAASADRVFVSFGIDYGTQVWIFRIAVFVLPAAVYFLTKRICEELRDSNWHPLRGPATTEVSRTRGGGYAPGTRRPD